MDRPVTNELSGRIYQASRIWTSNVYGAVVAGIGGAMLMSVVAGIIIRGAGELHSILFAIAWIVAIVLALLALYPGNLVGTTPYAVQLQVGRGLGLYAPLKRIYIPMEDISQVKKSFLRQGFVVKLKRRHRLLKGFSIHGGFGDQGTELVQAIQSELERLRSTR